MSTADEMKKLKELLDSEVITKEEFEMQKSKLLNDKNNKIPKLTINKGTFNLDNKNFKLLVVCLFVILCFFAFDSLFNTTTSSDVINSIKEQELAGQFLLTLLILSLPTKTPMVYMEAAIFILKKIEFTIWGHPDFEGGCIFL